MRSEHIIELLDRESVETLTEVERVRVEAHAAECAACGRSLAAARMAGALVAARASEIHEPSPFFATRVTAALRERASASEERSFGRVWRAARGLVVGMAVAVVLLAGAALETTGPPAQDAPTAPMYTAEWSSLESNEGAPADLSDDQLVAILYDSEDVYGQGR